MKIIFCLRSLVALFAAAAGLLASAPAGAETLVFSPEEGVTTNVSERLTGATSVSANPGASGGGTVRLTASYSDYTGTTANNCGYLWPEFLGFDSSYGSLGATSQLTLGPGTLKYTGQAGAISAPVVHSGENEYSVYEIGEGSELTLKGSLTGAARLVKTGAGTLRIAYEGSEQITLGGGGNRQDGCYRLELNANGDAPTGKGGSTSFAVVEGKVAIDSGNWILAGDNPVSCGLYTVADTGTEEKAQEPSGTFELNGGTVDIRNQIYIGVNNGFTMNTPDGRTSSAFVINGGSHAIRGNVRFGNAGYGLTSGLALNTNPRFEMHGGTCNHYPQCYFRMGERPGVLSELTFDGGTYTATYNAFDCDWISGITAGDAGGDATTTNIVTICGTADVTTGEIINKRDEITFVRLNEGGVFRAGRFYNTAGFLSIDFNGGTLYARFKTKEPLISNSVSRVSVGPKGGTIGASSTWNSHLAIVQKGIEPLPGLAAGADGGITFANVEAQGTVRLFGVNTHYGPTTIGRGTTELAGAARLSPNARLVLAGGTLVITNAAQTVAGLTIGATATTTAETLKYTKTLPLAVTGSFAIKGTPTLSVVPLEADGSVSTTLGAYTVLTAPKAQQAMLEAVAVRCTAPNIAGAYFNVVVDGDLAKLVIQATDPGLDPVDPNVSYWTATVGGAWMTAANWLYENTADSYDKSAVFAMAPDEGGATVTLPAAEVEVEKLQVAAGTYRVANGALHPLRMDVNATGELEISGGDHVVDGTLYLGGGDELTENKLTVSGGSLTCDKLYMRYKTGTANAESSTLEISDGVVTAKTEIIVGYNDGAGTNNIVMTGGKLVTSKFTVGYDGASWLAHTARNADLSFENCEIDLGTGTFNRSNTECARRVYFGAGAVLRAGRLVGDPATDVNSKIIFDGGTFRPTLATSDPATSGIKASYGGTGRVDSKGMLVDLSEVAPADGDIQAYVPIYFSLYGAHEMVVSGGGCAYSYGDQHIHNNSTIVASNGAAIIVWSDPNLNTGFLRAYNPIRIEPGAAFRFEKKMTHYQQQTVTLGRTGATVPARLEFNDEDGFALTTNLFTAEALVVRSPVSVAWCTNGWKGVATCPDGVYTGIVYTTSGSTVDTANFVLPDYYQSWKSLSTEIIDYSETQQALVFTVTTTGEEPEPPEPPAPEPETIETLVVPSGDTVALEDGTYVKNLTIGAGSWNTPAVSGDFFVTQAFALGLAAGEYASAKVSGDMTVKSGSVWKIDVNDALTKYDLLVVDGNLTVEKGAILDFGRTELNPLPRKFRHAPLAKVTGTITTPGILSAADTGWDGSKVLLSVEDGILYADLRVTRGFAIILK